ncbi:MAG: amidohydrolase [Dehalococcoidia bacterium]|nr:amidohydrolase [Dehalococcoidia bacterium]
MATLDVIDSDGHVREPYDMWPRYLDPQFHPVVPRMVRDNAGFLRRSVGGRSQPRPPGGAQGQNPQASKPGGYDGKVRIKDMDGEGIAISVLYPSIGLAFAAIPEVPICVAMCRAYNSWLHEFCKPDSNRLIGIAVVPQSDIQETLVETKRAVGTFGFKGIMLRPNRIGGRTLDDPHWEPLWSLLEDLDVALTLHEGTTQNVEQSGLNRYENFMFRHVCSHPHEQQMALLELICSGVLERHPTLRVAILESGCGWIGYWLERLDSHMHNWGHASIKLPLKPSQYWQRQCFISADPDEKMIGPTIMAIGDDTLTFATDYPHPDGIWPGVVAELANRTDISAVSKAKILGENARRLYKFNGKASGKTPARAAAKKL